MQAVKKFDPYREVKLSSYASWWIRAYILKFIIENWSLVKVGTTWKLAIEAGRFLHAAGPHAQLAVRGHAGPQDDVPLVAGEVVLVDGGVGGEVRVGGARRDRPAALVVVLPEAGRAPLRAADVRLARRARRSESGLRARASARPLHRP